MGGEVVEVFVELIYLASGGWVWGGGCLEGVDEQVGGSEVFDFICWEKWGEVQVGGCPEV